MKKLILSIFIVLGTIVSTQAQTFDFSCVVEGDINDDGTEASAPVINLEAYSEEQLATLSYAGFQEGISPAGDPVLTTMITFLHTTTTDFGTSSVLITTEVRIASQPSGFTYELYDEDGNLESVETGYFKITGHNFTPLYDSTIEGIIAQALTLVPDPNADDDSDGFTHGEERELDLSGFEDDNGTYQYFYTPPSATGFYIIISPEGNNLFFVYDDDGAITEMTGLTLREAVDYVRGLPVGQGTNG